MTGIAINLGTGRPTKWPKYGYETGVDRAEFWCVWNGQHYRLLSLSAHLEKKVPAGKSLIIDRMYHSQIVPQSEVHIGTRI